MKRYAISLGLLAILTLPGCGGSGNPPADGSNNPDEVQKYEQRRKEEREKGATPKGAAIATPNLKLAESPSRSSLRI